MDMEKMEKNGSPKISVIVPVYNTARYLARCLDSIAAQTFPDWECICVDDGSTDESGAMLDAYARRDARFRVIHQENGGVSRARNAGLDAARGEWISFADSDDWVEPETYELAWNAAQTHGADLVQWDYCSDGAGKSITGLALPEGYFAVPRDATYFCPSMCHKFVLRKRICDNRLRFPEDIRLSEDRLFALQCYIAAERCFHLDRCLYHYVENLNSATHTMTKEMIREGASAVCRMEEAVSAAALCRRRGGGMKNMPRSCSRRSLSRNCTHCSVCLNRISVCAAVFSRKSTGRCCGISAIKRRGQRSFWFLYIGIWIFLPAPVSVCGGSLQNGKRREPQLCTERAA